MYILSVCFIFIMYTHAFNVDCVLRKLKEICYFTSLFNFRFNKLEGQEEKFSASLIFISEGNGCLKLLIKQYAWGRSFSVIFSPIKYTYNPLSDVQVGKLRPISNTFFLPVAVFYGINVICLTYNTHCWQTSRY